jgi:hypothetical protein
VEPLPRFNAVTKSAITAQRPDPASAASFSSSIPFENSVLLHAVRPAAQSLFRRCYPAVPPLLFSAPNPGRATIRPLF